MYKPTGEKTTLSFPMSKADSEQQLPALLSAAQTSAFGHGGETVVDPSVRVAKELKPSQFELDFDPASTDILEKVGVCGVS